MAIIVAPTGQQIFDRAQRLSYEHFDNAVSDTDVVDLFNSVVTPAVQAKYAEMVDVAIAKTYPDYSVEQRLVFFNAQMPRFANSMMHEALRIVYGELVQSTEDWYAEQAEKHEELANAAFTREWALFEDLLSLDAPANSSGFGLLTVDIAPVVVSDEYAG